MVAEGAEFGIPSLPLDHASDALLKADPVLGAVIIFLAAALIAGTLIYTRTMKAKDEELAQSKSAHIADLKTMIPAVQELKETIMNTLVTRGRR
jgi:uncharacterized membrane protein YjgN (DUF898 family)